MKTIFPLVILVTALNNAAGQTVISNTSLGQVVGLTVPLPGLPNLVISRYTGIPYAEPPTGQLRFAKPVPKSPWDGVFNATVFGPNCPQIFPPNITGVVAQFLPTLIVDEDCLILNVYVPDDIVAASGPLPVMVFIHGGSFITGQGALYDGSLLAIHGQVVVVNFNYRLGLFGFLSTGDDSAPGNYGLWDQRLAIQWVKDNIENFGGDPNQITIFGESAGGWSAAYHMATPLNDRTLFQRVIAQSGVAFTGLVIPGEFALRQARGLALSLGCNLPHGSTTRHLISCLREFSMETLLSRASSVATAVTIDGEFLPENLNSLLSHPRLGQYDLIVGVTSQEGSIFLNVGDSLTAQGLRDSVQNLVSLTCHCENPQEVTEAIIAFYFGADKLDMPRENVLKHIDVAGDIFFNMPSVDFLRRHAAVAENTSTYFYYFTHETGKEYLLPPEFEDWIPGAPHVLDLYYVFGLINLLFPGDAESALLSTRMIGYWTQFARNGDPNGVGLPQWPEYEAENETYVVLEPAITTGQRFKADRIALWSNYLPTIIEPSDQTSCSYEVPVRDDTMRKPDIKTVEISSRDGQVLGSVIGALRVADEAMGGEVIVEFLGIPYAQPPVGDLRFRLPQDTGPWGDKPLDTPDQLPPACPQDVAQDPWMVRLGFNQTSEDCLTLNIYAPTTATNNSSLPVVIFIHPGFGVSGTSSIYDAVLLASRLKAVVVVINHRLGALGFLSTEDDAAPGNYGLHDVLAAIKWVNKYIESFGGDADRITVFGHDSGAILIHMLILSEKAENLFQQAVLISATAISPAVDNQVHPPASERAKALAIALDCPTTSSEMMINCLREKPAIDLVRNTQTSPFGLAFPTVVDGDILTEKPIELFKAGKINNVRLIVGFAQDENAPQSFVFFSRNINHCPNDEEIEQIIQMVSRLWFNNPGQASLALATEYLGRGGLGDDCETRGSFRRFMNDYMSVWSTLEAARLHADAGQSVYFFSFDHQPSTHYDRRLPPQAGPSARDDLQFLFGDPYSPLVDELQLAYRLEDKQFTLELTALLKNFIYDGEPGTSLSGVKWPVFDLDTLTYMSLTECPQAYSGHKNNWEHTLRFWVDFFPTITRPTSSPPTALIPPETTSSPPEEPCIVGEGIGLNLTPQEASTLIEALIGVVVGALVLCVFFFGGCMAYRLHARRAEAAEAAAKGRQDRGSSLPTYLPVAEKDCNTPL